MLHFNGKAYIFFKESKYADNCVSVCGEVLCIFEDNNFGPEIKAHLTWKNQTRHFKFKCDVTVKPSNIVSTKLWKLGGLAPLMFKYVLLSFDRLLESVQPVQHWQHYACILSSKELYIGCGI